MTAPSWNQVTFRRGNRSDSDEGTNPLSRTRGRYDEDRATFFGDAEEGWSLDDELEPDQDLEYVWRRPRVVSPLPPLPRCECCAEVILYKPDGARYCQVPAPHPAGTGDQGCECNWCLLTTRTRRGRPNTYCDRTECQRARKRANQRAARARKALSP